MGLKVTNNAFGTLNASITSSSTTIVLVAGQGARFPTLSAGDYFYATLIDTSNNLEIVKCTARSTDTLTVVRGQDNTTARAYATNDRFELRPTAALFNEKANANEYLPLAGGTLTGSLEVQASWRLSTNTGGGGVSAPFAGGLGGGFNPSNNIYSMYVRDRTDTYWNDLWLEAKTISLKSGSGGYNSLVADTSGRITMPQQPAFTAYNGTDVTGPTSALIWTSTELNRGSHYNTSNGRFTCPVAGVYVFHYRWISKSGETIQPRLFKNGTGIDGATQYGNPPSGEYFAGEISVAIQCNANDYITCGTLSGAPLQGPNYNSGFSGFLLG